MIWDFKKFGEKTALIDDAGKSITYNGLAELCDKIKEACGKRCLVFCMCQNSIGTLAGYAAFVNSDIVPVMLNRNMDKGLREELIRIYKPKFLWIPINQTNVKLHGRVYCEAYDHALIRTDYDEDERYPLNDDLCLLLTTSGSTGSPKFVRQSYKNVLSNAQSIAEYLQLDSTERPITSLPMNYTYGLSIINSHLLVGATILLTDKTMMQKEFWEFFTQEEATSFGGVPYTYEMLEKLRFARRDLPSLRYITQAGGKLTPQLHEKFAGYASEKGYKFIVMYGQCEATARMAYLPADKAIEKCGSMGIAIPGGKFSVIDENGSEITTPGIPGELVYEGDNVTLGYAESGEDLAKGDERGGILKTGDVAQFDEDGYYYIVGRMKRFLKIYGNRVNLDEVDRMIKTEFANIEVACTGVDDHMYIFLTGDSDGIADEVRKYIVDKTHLNPSAFKTIIIDEIPKNDSGKVLYKELSKYYE